MGWLQFTPSQYYLLTIQDGDTALILAAMEDNTLTVKALIIEGADPNIQNRVSGICFSIAIILSGISMNYNIGRVLSEF